MRILQAWKRVLLLLAFVVLARAGAVEAAPHITFRNDGATATGIKSGGDAVWFVRSVTEFSGMARLSGGVTVTPDSDSNGIVELTAPVVPASVWIVVDYATGEYAVARPDGTPVVPVLNNGRGWGRGRVDLDFPLTDVDVLLVRPGAGVWTLRAMQGGPLDQDHRGDGNLRIALADMQKIVGSQPTAHAALPGDLLIAIEPTSLWTFVRAAAENAP